jgi:hypothetical protein
VKQGKELQPDVTVGRNPLRLLQQGLEADMDIPIAAFLRACQRTGSNGAERANGGLCHVRAQASTCFPRFTGLPR